VIPWLDGLRIGPDLQWRATRGKALSASVLVWFDGSNLWENHRTSILIISGVVGVQSLLIANLLMTRRRTREMTESLDLAADAAGIGLWHRQAGSDLITATGRWREIYGLPPTGPLTLTEVLALLHPDDRPGMVAAIEQSARDFQPFALEHRIIQPGGQVRWLATHGRCDQNGGGTEIRGASLDITGRREAAALNARQRQELAHLSRVSSLGVLSGSLAHELNQPLGIILSNAQAAEYMLESDTPDLEELRAIIRDIVREDRRAGEVIQRLRSLLRRGETVRQPFDLNETVREVLRLTHSDLIARGVTVTTTFGNAVPQAVADRVHVQQVLLNLITNACDAMAENPPRERVLTIESGGGLRESTVSVHDCGSGLPDDTEKIFEAFHSTKAHGLGMGLAICRTLISAHNGRLWAQSRPGGGATFHMALPNLQPSLS
jgi:C4-dicarboxylate-specific signal transduction histidine kinase